MCGIIVGLYGGTGNQLFQYAMGLSLALRYGVSLYLDLYGFAFDKYYKRKYSLDKFCISRNQTVYKPYLFRTARLFRFLSYKIPGIKYIVRPLFIVESSKDYDESVWDIKLNHDKYLMGYWQDERYFWWIKEKIKQEFTLKNCLSPVNQEIAKMIVNTNAVAIHFRRLHLIGVGKKKSLMPNIKQRKVKLDISYYQKAMEYIEEHVEKPHYFVFSDLPEWPKQFLKSKFPITFLENNRGPDYEDIELMRLCKHHIIANSSFSWWGAWLGEKKGQIVIAPKDEIDGMPNIPTRWLRI